MHSDKYKINKKKKARANRFKIGKYTKAIIIIIIMTLKDTRL